MVNLNTNKIRILAITNPPAISKTFIVFLLLQQLFPIPVSSYVAEKYAINCGSSGDSVSTSDNRNWIGDVHSKLFSPIQQQKDHLSVAAVALELFPAVHKVPYFTARLSRSEFTYSIPVSDGPKLLRLHFYPASYPGFDRSNSRFTVKSGRFTLVKDFNTSFTVEPVSKEYGIHVEPNEKLNLTFAPSSSHPNAYGFINGIEIVSIPTDLYKLENNGDAFETLYRINVGGGQISAAQDTAMFRPWDDDVPYLKHADSLTVVAAGFGLKPIHRDGRDNYAAPEQLYLTARAYGTNRTSRNNVTWEFPVHSGFAYKVRLHFCEFDRHVQQAGDRVFQIFIADKLVEPRADVVEWSRGIHVPIYKDYAVDMLSKGNAKKINLSVKLQPNPVSRFNDVLMNGIEVFKLSDENNNLGGSEPDPPPSPPLPSSPKRPKSSNHSVVFAAIAALLVIVLLLLVILFLIYRRRRRRAAKALLNNTNSPTPSDHCRVFSTAEIRAATDDFLENSIVGQGGFGDVYKGYIDNGTKPVAIKRLRPDSDQGAHEFRTEINMLSQLRHPNLVPLIGYCSDGDEMMLVYDFMARGTLRDHLHNARDHSLSWKQRLEICLGAAKGLQYLHTDAKDRIIHRDVKTTNILLDENWVAKVSDFGLSKMGPPGMSRSHITTEVKGSFAYLDPEYCMSLRLTTKSDVYSFGVVLLEVLCGRPPMLRMVEKHQYSSLVAWVKESHKKGEVDQTVDPELKGTINPRCLKKFADMALSCLHEQGKQRPSMSEVVRGLESVLKLQERTEEEMGTLPIEKKAKSEERSTLSIERKAKSEEIRSAKANRFMDDGDEESDVQFSSTEASTTTTEHSKCSSKVTMASSEEEQALVYGVL